MTGKPKNFFILLQPCPEAETDAEWLHGEQSAYFPMLAFSLPSGHKQHCLKTWGCFFSKKRRGSSGCFVDIVQFEKFAAAFWSIYILSLVLCVTYKIGTSYQSWHASEEKSALLILFLKQCLKLWWKIYHYVAMLRWEGWMALWSVHQDLV